MIMPSTAATNAARAFGKCAVMLPYHGFTVEKLDFGFPSGAGFCRDTSVCMVRYQDRLVAWRRVSCESAPLSRESVPFGGCIAFDSGIRHGLKLKKGVASCAPSDADIACSRCDGDASERVLCAARRMADDHEVHVSFGWFEGTRQAPSRLHGVFRLQVPDIFRGGQVLDVSRHGYRGVASLMPGMPFGFLVPEK